MIQLRQINKTYKGITLFRDLNVCFESGKKTLIRGANGSGKSVLLKMIVGYSTPDSGSIRVDDFAIGKDGDFIPDAGVSINAPEFMKSWSGMENLLYLAKIRKVAGEAEIVALAKQLGLADDLAKKYKTYSLGMRQKLRIIQALMEKPRYLILDEPFDALDKTSKATLTALLNDYLLQDDTRTLLYTDHSDAAHEGADVVFEIDECTLHQVTQAG